MYVGYGVLVGCAFIADKTFASIVASKFDVTVGGSDVDFAATSCFTLASTVASRLGVGTGAPPAHAAVVTTITAASKAITLLNRVAIAGYYTHAVTIEHVREGNPD